jgi:hypothetical protein
MLKSLSLALAVATLTSMAIVAPSFAAKNTGAGPTSTPTRQVCKNECIPVISCPPGKDVLSGICKVKMQCKNYCRPA